MLIFATPLLMVLSGLCGLLVSRFLDSLEPVRVVFVFIRLSLRL